MATKTYTATDCTYVNWYNPSSNYSTATELHCGITNAGDYPQRWVLIQSPPLSWYDDVSSINSLYLYLYGYSAQASPLAGCSWSLPASSWDEANVTWNNKPNFGTRTDSVGTFPYGSGNEDWIYCNLGSTTGDNWRNEVANNYGIYLTRYLANGLVTNYAWIHSEDNASENGPYFYMDYEETSSAKQLHFKVI